MKITKISTILFLLIAIASTILAGEDIPTQQKPENPDPPLSGYKSGKMPPAYNNKNWAEAQKPEHGDSSLPKGWHPKHPSATNEIQGKF